MRTKVASVFFCVLLFGLAVQAQEFWQKKDPSKWSESECKRLYNDSPWAKGHDIAFNQDYSQSSRGNVRSQSGMDASPQTGQSTGYVVAFWSALPVRQGYVQFAKLHSKYDKLPPDKKEVADKQYQQILGQQFADSIVLRVSFYSTIRETQTALGSYWQSQSLQSLKSSFYLIAHGQRISPVNFSATPDDFIVVFPRQLNGEPVVKPGDKSISVEFQHPRMPNADEARVFIDFPMKKMLDAQGQQTF